MTFIWVGVAASVALLVWLAIQRWFWVTVFFFAGLASCFAMIASIIHFQIILALGMFVLMVVCWMAASKVLEGASIASK